MTNANHSNTAKRNIKLSQGMTLTYLRTNMDTVNEALQVGSRQEGYTVAALGEAFRILHFSLPACLVPRCQNIGPRRGEDIIIFTVL